MRHRATGKTAVVALAVIAATTIWSAQASAAHDFEFEIDRYAAVDTLYATFQLKGIAINTGTEADTLDLSITKEEPPMWDISLCIKGVCIGDAGFAYLEPGDTVDFYVLVLSWAPADMGTAVLTGTYRHAPGVTKSEPFAAFTDLPSILLVDDDNGAGHETYMETAVEAAGYECHVYDADTYGRPGLARLRSYWATLWTTADGDASYITSGDEQDMMDYLDAGGNLYLASAAFLPSRGAPTTFITDYLHVTSWTDSVGATSVAGVAGDPVSDGMSLDLTGGPLTVSDDPGIDCDDGDVCFISGGTDTMGTRVEEGMHKVIFTTFPFENVSTSDPDPDNQKTLIGRIIAWFDPPTVGIEDQVVDAAGLVLRQNSPNPFGGSTRLVFAVAQPGAHAELEIYNVNGQLVRTLLSGPAAERHNSVVWDGTDDAGRRCASGVYFYKLASDNQSAIKKMVLLK